MNNPADGTPFQRTSYLRREERWQPVRGRLLQAQSENWQRALSTVISELTPAEAFRQGSVLENLQNRLQRGFMPAPGQSLATTAPRRGALDLVIRKELGLRNSCQRDVLPHLIDMLPDFKYCAGPKANPLIVEWGEIPFAPLGAARQMFACGADINARSGEGTTALMWRTYHKDVGAVASLLMDMQANATLADRSGLTAPAIAQALQEARPQSLRGRTMVDIYKAHAAGAPRDEVVGMAGYCEDVRSERFRSRRLAAAVAAPAP